MKTDIAALVENMIDLHGVIPARYMSKICKYHFQYHNYKSTLKRLKLKGVEEATQKFDGISMKVYESK